MIPMELSYILNELGENRQDYFNAVAPPIIQTSNFAFKKVEDLRNAFADEASAYLYSRGNNPTLKILSQKLAALDGAEDCLVFNSGAGAIFAAVLANVKSGDHIVSVHKPYSWTQNLFNEILPRFNVTTTYIDGRETDNFRRALRDNTVIIYLETPNSWTFHLQNLKEVALLAKEKNILTICDNSYCSPLHQRPLEYGIDLVLQSATKYINGHSDVVAGVLCGTNEMMTRIFNSEYMNMGIGTTPFNAWLMIRGLRTLKIRLEKISDTTPKVVQFLKQHRQVEAIIFPFDNDFPQYQLARQQMQGACGLFSFVIKSQSLEKVEQFCEGLQHILMAVSWGGHESLIIPGCAVVNRNDFDPGNTDHRTMRMYVGLEEASYLIEDLERGFEAMQRD
jgi:cystathionine beta-lyase/cystathionine gamma-synthase